MLLDSIQRMYEEIIAYDGDFGDPIAEFVDFQPLAALQGESERTIRLGAAIGLLVNFAVTVDNSDFRAALKTNAYREIERSLEQGLLTEFPLVAEAAKRASESEFTFGKALRSVYLTYIRKPNL